MNDLQSKMYKQQQRQQQQLSKQKDIKKNKQKTEFINTKRYLMMKNTCNICLGASLFAIIIYCSS